MAALARRIAQLERSLSGLEQTSQHDADELSVLDPVALEDLDADELVRRYQAAIRLTQGRD